MSDFTQQMQRMMQMYMKPQTQMQYPQLPQAGGPQGPQGLLDTYGAMKNQMQQHQSQQQPMTIGNPDALMGSMSNGQAPIMPATGSAPAQTPTPTPAPQQPPDASADATGAKSSFGQLMQGLSHPQAGAGGGGGGKGGSGSVTGALAKIAMM